MAEEDIELAVQAPKSSKPKLFVLVALGMLVAVGATLGGLFAAGMLPTKGAAAADADTAVEEVAREEAVYVALDPPFTVNFSGEGAARFLQVTLEAMTRDPGVESALRQHIPVIRNDLMLLFSSKTAGELGTRDGKQALQAEALASIQGVLERETSEPGIEAVYFTSFVMQ